MIRWPKEVPWLQAENMRKRTFGRIGFNCHCLGGWVIEVFDRNQSQPNMSSRWYMVNTHPFVDMLCKELHHRLRRCTSNALGSMNDDSKLSLQDLADVWNTCIEKKGYIKTSSPWRRR